LHHEGKLQKGLKELLCKYVVDLLVSLRNYISWERNRENPIETTSKLINQLPKYVDQILLLVSTISASVRPDGRENGRRRANIEGHPSASAKRKDAHSMYKQRVSSFIFLSLCFV
jgi:hypothetical protein